MPPPGSKELGIPTANLDAESLRGSLGEAVTGIYAGWASVGRSPEVYPMCMSVGGCGERGVGRRSALLARC